MDIISIIEAVGNVLFSMPVVYAILATGILFTIWSGFGQWRALTHGVQVVRGKYDEGHDPGAISHFQALTTALSATVGLGNIAGVGIAVATGGPGAVFWMWVIGFIGMALKMTEVTQSMLYRNTADPKNPHGGPMFVAKYGFARWGLPGVGSTVGGLFVVTLLISAITGGNMFQAWSVADTTKAYFGLNSLITGAILVVVTGAVIIGGIRWIGRVTATIVPLMCGLYVLAALVILLINITEIPAMLWLIVRSGVGLGDAEPAGAFVGGAVGFAFVQGMKRALFSSESGQGSAPIAHSAARTDEPVREGVVAGLEPFIDTIVVCTMTALVILSTGALTREAEATVAGGDDVFEVVPADGEDEYTLAPVAVSDLPPRTQEARERLQYGEGENYRVGDKIAVLLRGDDREDTGANIYKLVGEIVPGQGGTPPAVRWEEVTSRTPPTLVDADGGGYAVYGEYVGSTLTAHAFDRMMPGLGKWLIIVVIWLFAISTIISWSYYGEQGVIFLFGDKAVLPYKLVYLGFVLVACWPGLVTTSREIDVLSALGLGVMLVVNIPLMLIFGPQAMRAYHDYFRREKQGPMHDEIGADGTTPEQREPTI